MAATDAVLAHGLSEALDAAMACDEKLAIEVVAFVDMLALLVFEGRKALAKVCRMTGKLVRLAYQQPLPLLNVLPRASGSI